MEVHWKAVRELERNKKGNGNAIERNSLRSGKG